jgi:hypothetical protein
MIPHRLHTLSVVTPARCAGYDTEDSLQNSLLCDLSASVQPVWVRNAVVSCRPNGHLVNQVRCRMVEAEQRLPA